MGGECVGTGVYVGPGGGRSGRDLLDVGVWCEKKGKKIVNFAITAVLVFNRRGFVVRRGSVRAWTFRC